MSVYHVRMRMQGLLKHKLSCPTPPHTHFRLTPPLSSLFRLPQIENELHQKNNSVLPCYIGADVHVVVEP